ncbi:MAG: hypothetical protein A3C85_02980 [Candidatus Doudnabacteria bacterium RIFCSPHIGHO2_02_FULL_48_21]|uniref:Uncharacterized protein n=1 Tax=Candidatus Doudnabacteria bacterium RIFCSPLOWO2_02_FULL_48_13 TaxID=1817845 RepID=A0A1F5QD67_9BACT|nr:MAG: hypothetical protein A3K05_00240 [Candidatus Doudnabacteria bacterium RIFCSPHIGHO2_01_48_18]OGE79454.1 MAG: hypothetical protein A2668_02065 [Candidatus Doudnabacteria bacterium RIFCSPHIGHO2_01_FULL_48_180]OGE91613.1 MAG: hypothetical protein A3F44_02810 [Candidatus Doudnabacteria bacterium RIFCSPHIGHO2_12_FULL_47_25]OGE93228.1 MAG: hypothetical protein A3C85_02980 [Candidatus Doudnabacteria bacterium RIFCSPHIGHO2_02_FULL_48_21]OGE97917.1 MAG: hypothetical protein A3A83_03130 [Candidatu
MNYIVTHGSEKIEHYYGDAVRMLFLVAAIIMLTSLPMFDQYINIPTVFSVLAILILGLAAGLTNPRQIWDAGINMGVSSAGFLVFMTYAVNSYQASTGEKFFLTNLVLGFTFLLSTYFSVKTFRGLFLQRRDSDK